MFQGLLVKISICARFSAIDDLRGTGSRRLGDVKVAVKGSMPVSKLKRTMLYSSK